MPTPVTVYADADGALSFYSSKGATEVPFELADGYRVGPGFTGVLAIFDAPGTLGMTLEQALTARVLRPVFDKPISSAQD
jgi:hypothetical protein